MIFEKRLKQDVCLLMLCLSISFLLLLICSNNSFLCSFNDGVDLNWFLTVGRGMLDGKVPYKDMFEHKGPITYFIYAFCELFKNPYIIVFVLEIISMALFMFFTYKIARRFFYNKKLSITISIISASLILTTRAFVQGGGSLEEFALPILAYIFYLFITQLKTNKTITKPQSLIVGFWVGVAFWAKYTTAVMMFVVLFAWLIFNIKNKNTKQSFLNVLFMIVGFLIPTIFVFIYFLLNNAVYDLFYTYFYINLFAYSKVVNIKIILARFFDFDNICQMLTLASAVCCIKNLKHFIYFVFIYFASALFVFFTYSQWYYVLEFYVFVPFGVIGISELVQLIFKNVSINNVLGAIITGVFIVFCFGYAFKYSNSKCEWGYKKQDYIQFQIAHDINNSNIENKSLFCYLMPDFGFYQALDYVPDQKYFAKNNFTEKEFPELFEAHNNVISKQQVSFVVMYKDVYKKNKDFLEKYYSLFKEYQYHYHECRVENWIFEAVVLIKN